MKYSTNLFNYYSQHNEFSQEASSLPQFNGGDTIVLTSARTGVEKTFKLNTKEFNHLGDEKELVAWHYNAVDRSNMIVSVWND